MTLKQRIQQCEEDIDRLVNHAQSVVPSLERLLEDSSDWRKDIRQTLLQNLQGSIENAIKHKQERKHDKD